MHVLPVRSDSILIELAGLDEALALYDALAADMPAGVLDMIPAARTVMICFDPVLTGVEDLMAAIAAVDTRRSRVSDAVPIEIPVRYDGEDLPAVAAMLEMSVEEVVRRHVQSDYRVAFTGFAPGFAYLADGDPQLCVPRRTSPRTHVPAGAVALADAFSGVYPKESPGGWQLIGTTPLAMFDLMRDPPSLLQPGQRVRFRDITADRAYAIRPQPENPSFLHRAPTGKSEGACAIEVVSMGFPVLFQDLGRKGLTRQGIGASGAADQASLRAANRLVGNDPSAAGLEIVFGHFSFRMRGRGVMAVTGASLPIAITTAAGATFDASHSKPLPLEDGDTVSLGAAQAGLRAYLAVRGGFDVAPVLGSLSTDMLARIGPAPLAAGEVIGILEARPGSVVALDEIMAFSMPRADEVLWLDVVLGPRDGWFTPRSIEHFLSREWTVSPQSSRVGIRLEGEVLERGISAELPSEATLRGAIQVPANGQPVLFLADHPLTGGYPVIANVATHHLDLAGQAPVGARIRFRALSPDALSLMSGKPS